MTPEQILTGIQNASVRYYFIGISLKRLFKGSRPPIEQLGFERHVPKRIEVMREASLECVDLVYEELVKIIEHCAVHDMERFPRLGDRINEVVTSLLRSRVNFTKDMVQNLIDMHCAYINTKHPDFTNGKSKSQALSAELNKKPSLPSINPDKPGSNKKEPSAPNVMETDNPYSLGRYEFIDMDQIEDVKLFGMFKTFFVRIQFLVFQKT